MGSRFGGLKQLTPVTEFGDTLIDFNLYACLSAGFTKAVFIIREEILNDFEPMFEKLRPHIQVEYCFQDTKGINKEREKPFGTGHAILCAREKIGADDFIVINADDFYGKECFEIAGANLGKGHFLVGYKLENTLSENGTVSRGIITFSGDILTSIEEVTNIAKNNDYPKGTLVSMNLWGFKNSILSEIAEQFESFLDTTADILKDEFYIPTVVKSLSGKAEDVRVLKTDDEWIGITYKEDLEQARQKIKTLQKKGMFPEQLWK